MAGKPAASLDRSLDWLGRRLAGALAADTSGYAPFTPSDHDTLWRVVAAGRRDPRRRPRTGLDRDQVSGAIGLVAFDDVYRRRVRGALQTGMKRTGWPRQIPATAAVLRFVETRPPHQVDLSPVGFDARECGAVIDVMTARIDLRYDMHNIFDLLRELLPTPVPLPVHRRRRRLAFGSRDPTRAIFLALIAGLPVGALPDPAGRA